jgi:hypothetical protein
VDFLVALSDVAGFVDPELCVLDLLGVGIVAGLVDAYRDGERVLLGQLLEAEDEDRLVDGCAELEGLLGAMADVVGGLWEEDGLQLMSDFDHVRCESV